MGPAAAPGPEPPAPAKPPLPHCPLGSCVFPQPRRQVWPQRRMAGNTTLLSRWNWQVGPRHILISDWLRLRHHPHAFSSSF